MVRPLKPAARFVLELLSTWAPEHRDALRVVQMEKSAAPHSINPSRKHLDNAISWLKRAQDSDPSGGVAWGYRLRKPVRTGYPLGWIPPYPETTGYIIPTMLRYADLSGDQDSIERARRMANWELSIQLPDGGIQGGIYGAQPVESSTFVTGQVLFGFVAAYQRFGEEAIKQGAIRGADWLLSCLDANGRFVKGYSHFCEPGPKAYEVRTGLALAEFGELINRNEYRDAASSMAEFALECQNANGWFRQNDLDDHNVPLTHTIGYVLEGLHGIGTILNKPECVNAIKRTLDSVAPLIQANGFLAGRWKKDWSPAVDWACLTGSAQIAGVFLRMYRQNGDPRYLEAGRKLLGFVCFTQDLKPGNPAVDGAIRGSYPVQGNYGQWCVLNWATKFFADSVMDYLSISPTAAS